MPLSNSLNDDEILEYCYARIHNRIPFFRGEEINRLRRLTGVDSFYHYIEYRDPILTFPTRSEVDGILKLIYDIDKKNFELESRKKIVRFPSYLAKGNRKEINIWDILCNDNPIVLSLDNGEELTI